MKSCVKNQLIEDYIIIKSINFRCNKLFNLNDEGEKILTKSEKLLKIYEKLIFKFNLMDLSFCLLNKEMSKNFEKDSEILKYSLLELLNKFKLKLEEIEMNLTEKLKKLKINEFEAQFLIMDKCN